MPNKRKLITRFFPFPLLIVILLSMTACKRPMIQHGYSFKDLEGKQKGAISSIIPGKTNELDVLNSLGSPSCTSNFAPRTFFYIDLKTTNRPIIHPKLVEQAVLEVIFDDNHIVKGIRAYDDKDRKSIIFCKEYIKVEGNKLNFMQQAVKNIGRFNEQ